MNRPMATYIKTDPKPQGGIVDKLCMGLALTIVLFADYIVDWICYLAGVC